MSARNALFAVMLVVMLVCAASAQQIEEPAAGASVMVPSGRKLSALVMMAPRGRMLMEPKKPEKPKTAKSSNEKGHFDRIQKFTGGSAPAPAPKPSGHRRQ